MIVISAKKIMSRKCTFWPWFFLHQERPSERPLSGHGLLVMTTPSFGMSWIPLQRTLYPTIYPTTRFLERLLQHPNSAPPLLWAPRLFDGTSTLQASLDVDAPKHLEEEAVFGFDGKKLVKTGEYAQCMLNVYGIIYFYSKDIVRYCN